jgi:uncharacterized membrane protein
MKPRAFLQHLSEPAVLHAIRTAEQRTSAEIRIFVCSRRALDPIKEAWSRFARLKMDLTEERNGVLIFLAPASQKFAIIGDVGIHRQAGDALWHTAAAALAGALKVGDPTAGVVTAIGLLTTPLARFFPPRAAAVNELPDEVVYGE